MEKVINIKTIEKNKKIKKELSKLNKIFKDIPEDKKNVVKGLIENAAFMGVTLKDLQELINTKGYTEEYQNGEHHKGTKKCPEVEIYNTMIKNYTNVVKQLMELLPKQPDDDDGFMAFVMSKND